VSTIVSHRSPGTGTTWVPKLSILPREIHQRTDYTDQLEDTKTGYEKRCMTPYVLATEAM